MRPGVGNGGDFPLEQGARKEYNAPWMGVSMNSTGKPFPEKGAKK